MWDSYHSEGRALLHPRYLIGSNGCVGRHGFFMHSRIAFMIAPYRTSMQASTQLHAFRRGWGHDTAPNPFLFFPPSLIFGVVLDCSDSEVLEG